MGYKHFKPMVKYVSRKASLQKLDMTEKQFNRLCVLFAVYPVITDVKNCYDKIDGWYYRIEDIKRMFYSEAREILRRNVKKEIKRQELVKFKQLERAAKIIDDEFNLSDLVKHKYPTFGESIGDLGNTLRNLYLIDMLAIDSCRSELEIFETFVAKRGFLSMAFMSKKGVYFGVRIEKVLIAWMAPYPGLNLKDIVEEKIDTSIVRHRIDFDFLDFGSFSEEESEDVEEIDPNDPNKFDISLLKYASPLLKLHVRLTVHKLCLLYPIENPRRNTVFKDMKFYINVQSIASQISFSIISSGGELVEYENAKFIISEVVDQIDSEKKYVQPQYIFDSVNQGHALCADAYSVGKELPPHISPFPDVMDTIDDRTLKILSNKKKYSILDRVEVLD